MTDLNGEPGSYFCEILTKVFSRVTYCSGISVGEMETNDLLLDP